MRGESSIPPQKCHEGDFLAASLAPSTPLPLEEHLESVSETWARGSEPCGVTSPPSGLFLDVHVTRFFSRVLGYKLSARLQEKPPNSGEPRMSRVMDDIAWLNPTFPPTVKGALPALA